MLSHSNLKEQVQTSLPVKSQTEDDDISVKIVFFFALLK